MKKFLLANAIAILVVFAIIAIILVANFDSGRSNAGRDYDITLYFSNDAENMALFGASYQNTIELVVPRYHRGEGEVPSSARRGVRTPNRGGRTPEFNLPGHRFVGWRDTATGEHLYEGRNRPRVPSHMTEARTFVAMWEEQTFTVRFEVRASVNAPSVNTSNFTIEWGTNIGTRFTELSRIFPEFAAGTRPTHNWGGWWTETNGHGTQITTATQFRLTSTNNTVTLFGYWTPVGGGGDGGQPGQQNVNVIFNLTGGNISGNTSNVTRTLTGNTLQFPQNPTRHLYGFNGWRLGNTVIRNGAELRAVAGNASTLTLTADWQVNIVITFHSFNGTFANGVLYILDVLYVNALRLPTPPTRNGFTFAGWRFNAAVTISTIHDGPLLRAAATGAGLTSVTLTAIWI